MVSMSKSAYKPISDYGIIGNLLSAALVGTDGSIDWCCLPRFDSPSIFAAILDDEKGGKFLIQPHVLFESSQAYITNTNVLQTTFKTETGVATVTDFMPCYQSTRHRVTRFYEIHRLVDCSEGQVSLEVLFQPKPGYGQGNTLIKPLKYGVLVSHYTGTVALSSPVPFTISGDKAVGRWTMKKGQRV